MAVRINPVSRRTFLKTSSAALLATPFINPRWARAGQSANEKLNIACVGVQNRGWANVSGVRGENIVALCDVDTNCLAAAAKSFPEAAQFADYREMLDRIGNDIDAVVVSTPDHCHAPIASAAMQMGKHVYCEKPLAHTVAEVRRLSELAKEYKVATQMGTQIHAEPNYRRVVELIRSGAIGQVKDVHVWSNKSWSNGRKKVGSPCPKNLDWNLWLGPSNEQPYSEGVHPANWRRFWEWGTGTMGDMACHHMDLAHWALGLRTPIAAETTGPEVHEVGTPEWCTARFWHGPSGGRPPITVTWYDGVSNRPELLKELTHKDGSPVQWGDGNLFVGEKGYLLADYGRYLLLPEEKFEHFQPPEKTIPDSIGHHREWIEACKGDWTKTLCNFDYSGSLTETVLLGNVAYRCGRRLEWDSNGLRAVNYPDASQYIHVHHRAGWEV